MLFFVILVIAIVVGITCKFDRNFSWLSIRTFGLSYLTNDAFDPVHNTYGVLPAIFGTIVTSVFALIFALPIGVGRSFW